MNVIDKNIERLKKLCSKHRVAKLYVFGSAISDHFSKDSDIDFKFSLEDLFNRDIDLLEEKAIKNPFFKQSIDNSKKIIYGY